MGRKRRLVGGDGCLNNRYHDPMLGSFISVDPLVTTTGEPYLYGSANPATLSDPSGLCSADPRERQQCEAEASGPGTDLWFWLKSQNACENGNVAACDTTPADVGLEPVDEILHGDGSRWWDRLNVPTVANVLDSTLSIVGDFSDEVATASAWVAAGCAGLAAAEKDLAVVGVSCAGIAAGVGGSATATKVTVELYEERKLSNCTAASAAHEVLVPGGRLGEYGASAALEFVKQSTGGLLGLTCSG